MTTPSPDTRSLRVSVPLPRSVAGLLALIVALVEPAGARAQAPAVAGTFQGFGSSTVGVIDVDGDGIQDIVSVVPETAPSFPPPLRIDWRRGRGDGFFDPPAALFEDVSYPQPVGVFLPLLFALDADDDGLEDLLVASRLLYRPAWSRR